LDQIATPAAENKYVARKWILLENGLYRGTQSSESAAQIRYSRGYPDVRARRQCNHRASPSSAARTHSGSALPSMRIRAWPRSISIMPDFLWLDLRRDVGCSGCTASETFTGTR